MRYNGIDAGIIACGIILGGIVGLVCGLGGYCYTYDLYCVTNYPDVADIDFTQVMSWAAHLYAVEHLNWIAISIGFGIPFVLCLAFGIHMNN